METLLIGMLLAFILGAITAILPLWLSNSELLRKPQQRTFPTTSVAIAESSAEKPIEPKEKTMEEKKQEARLSELQNMWDYDGRPQEGEKVGKR